MSCADEVAITRLEHRYVQAIDRRDIDGILSCFTPDALVSYDDGRIQLDGHAGLREFFGTPKSLWGPGESTHGIQSIVVTVDGDTARVEMQVVAFLMATDRPDVHVRAVVYLDECVCGADGAWLLCAKAHIPRWQGKLPKTEVARVEPDAVR